MPHAPLLNFVRQQGFEGADERSCACHFSALMFQPRIVGGVLLVLLYLQSGPLFLVLSALLWWNALVPRRNPFDHLYNLLVARPRGLPPLVPAPAPRRFAQGMAATFMLAIGTSLLGGWRVVAWTAEVLVAVAIGALLFGKFCLGSYLYHLLRGKAAFANRTLPWSRPDGGEESK